MGILLSLLQSGQLFAGLVWADILSAAVQRTDILDTFLTSNMSYYEESQRTGQQHPDDHKTGLDSYAPDSPQPTGRRDSVLIGDKSPGVARIEAVSEVLTRTDRAFLFLGVFIIAYAYGLDGTLRYSYQPTATATMGSHSLLATITVLRSVIAAAAQPTAAKIADIFGRLELVFVSVVFYTLGTIIEACATNVSTFAGGAVLYQIGYTCVILLVEVIIADITSLRARLFFSYIPYQHLGLRRCGISCPWGYDLAMGHRHVGHHLPSVCPPLDACTGGDGTSSTQGWCFGQIQVSLPTHGSKEAVSQPILVS